MAAMGITTLAWAMAMTIARVAARCRLEAPRCSIMARVATGAAKLTKLICSAANTPSPVSPAGASSGARRAITLSRTPRASSSRMRASITIMMGSRTKRASSTAELPARRMMSVRSSMGRIIALQHPAAFGDDPYSRAQRRAPTLRGLVPGIARWGDDHLCRWCGCLSSGGGRTAGAPTVTAIRASNMGPRARAKTSKLSRPRPRVRGSTSSPQARNSVHLVQVSMLSSCQVHDAMHDAFDAMHSSCPGIQERPSRGHHGSPDDRKKNGAGSPRRHSRLIAGMEVLFHGLVQRQSQEFRVLRRQAHLVEDHRGLVVGGGVFALGGDGRLHLGEFLGDHGAHHVGGDLAAVVQDALGAHHPLPDLGAADLGRGGVFHQVVDGHAAVAGEPGAQVVDAHVDVVAQDRKSTRLNS